MELNEEEKKAIEFLKTFINTEIDYCELEKTDVIDILNVIEKQDYKIKFFIENEIALKEMNRNQMKIIDNQQKEIEELKLDLEEMTKSYNHMKENWVHKLALKSYIRKDKIREKIEDLKEIADEDSPDAFIKIDALEELLEEE